jgi:hypothetical protein
MSDQPMIVATFSLIGVIVGGALQYIFSRALESRKQLALQRGQSYVDYFRAVALIAHNGRAKENLSLAADAKARICIYGSPGVVNQLHAFIIAGENTGETGGMRAAVELLKEMRTDIGKDNRTLAAETVQHILFGLRTRDYRNEVDSRR